MPRRFCIAILYAATATTALLEAMAADRLSAQTLPAAVATVEHARQQLQFEHAAGMVRGAAPAEWHIGERAVGREVHLVLTPAPLGTRGVLPATHIWLTVHALVTDADIRQLMQRRLENQRTVASGQPAGMPPLWPVECSGHAGQMATYQRHVAGGTRHVVHAIVQTPWGLCEWHVESPDADWTREWSTQVIAQWHIGPPRQRTLPASPQIEAAGEALGSWKGSGSRMRLLPDGRFELVWDRRRLTEAGTYERVLIGSFAARDDLLFVTFSDGSRRHYRWRRVGPWLLLTDHEGRTAQLRYLYE